MLLTGKKCKALIRELVNIILCILIFDRKPIELTVQMGGKWDLDSLR